MTTIAFDGRSIAADRMCSIGNHRSGFAVLTFRDGQLLMPEVAMKFDEDSFEFRGHVLHADTGAVL